MAQSREAPPAPVTFSAADENFVCSICMDVWREPHAISPCGHTFCKGCITRSLRACPLCRGQIRNNAPATAATREAALAVAVQCDLCGWRGTAAQRDHHVTRCVLGPNAAANDGVGPAVPAGDVQPEAGGVFGFVRRALTAVVSTVAAAPAVADPVASHPTPPSASPTATTQASAAPPPPPPRMPPVPPTVQTPPTGQSASPTTPATPTPAAAPAAAAAPAVTPRAASTTTAAAGGSLQPVDSDGGTQAAMAASAAEAAAHAARDAGVLNALFAMYSRLDASVVASIWDAVRPDQVKAMEILHKMNFDATAPLLPEEIAAERGLPARGTRATRPPPIGAPAGAEDDDVDAQSDADAYMVRASDYDDAAPVAGPPVPPAAAPTTIHHDPVAAAAAAAAERDAAALAAALAASVATAEADRQRQQRYDDDDAALAAAIAASTAEAAMARLRYDPQAAARSPGLQGAIREADLFTAAAAPPPRPETNNNNNGASAAANNNATLLQRLAERHQREQQQRRQEQQVQHQQRRDNHQHAEPSDDATVTLDDAIAAARAPAAVAPSPTVRVTATRAAEVAVDSLLSQFESGDATTTTSPSTATATESTTRDAATAAAALLAEFQRAPLPTASVGRARGGDPSGIPNLHRGDVTAASASHREGSRNSEGRGDSNGDGGVYESALDRMAAAEARRQREEAERRQREAAAAEEAAFDSLLEAMVSAPPVVVVPAAAPPLPPPPPAPAALAVAAAPAPPPQPTARASEAVVSPLDLAPPPEVAARPASSSRSQSPAAPVARVAVDADLGPTPAVPSSDVEVNNAHRVAPGNDDDHHVAAAIPATDHDATETRLSAPAPSVAVAPVTGLPVGIATASAQPPVAAAAQVVDFSVLDEEEDEQLAASRTLAASARPLDLRNVFDAKPRNDDVDDLLSRFM